MPGRKRPRKTVAGRIVGGMAAGALPPLFLAVGVHNVLESHLAVVSGVDRKFASTPFEADRAEFPTVVKQRQSIGFGSTVGIRCHSCGGPHRERT